MGVCAKDTVGSNHVQIRDFFSKYHMSWRIYVPKEKQACKIKIKFKLVNVGKDFLLSIACVN